MSLYFTPIGLPFPACSPLHSCCSN